MVNIVPIICAVIFLIGILVVISVLANPVKTTSLQNVYNDIAFPTGDHIIFYQQAQQAIANAAQLSTSPSSPLKFLAVDSHNNVIAQNTTSKQIINASAGTTQANQIIATTTPSTPTASTYLTTTGNSYGAGSSIGSPVKSTTCNRGMTCTISGKIIIADPSTCRKQTINGVMQNVCTNLLGPFKYTMQIICADTNAFRCSYLSGELPTTRGETYPDGTFSYDWTPKGDAYYVGSYIARLYAESEPSTINGPTVSESGDYQITVY